MSRSMIPLLFLVNLGRTGEARRRFRFRYPTSVLGSSTSGTEFQRLKNRSTRIASLVCKYMADTRLSASQTMESIWCGLMPESIKIFSLLPLFPPYAAPKLLKHRHFTTQTLQQLQTKTQHHQQ